MMPRGYSEGKKMGDMDVNICKYNKTISDFTVGLCENSSPLPIFP